MNSSKINGLEPFLTIDSELSLHLARPELSQAIFEAVDADRNYLRQWLPWVDNTQSLADTEKFIRRSMEVNSSGDQLISFVVFKEELAGSVGAVKINKDRRSCEIGFWLRSKLQGQGIMTRSCAALINYLLCIKNLNRIEIFAARDNLKSQAVCQRLGFIHEGTKRQAIWLNHQYHDLELFALLKSDWLISNSF